MKEEEINNQERRLYLKQVAESDPRETDREREKQKQREREREGRVKWEMKEKDLSFECGFAVLFY